MRLTRKALAALAITPLLLGGLGVLPAQAAETQETVPAQTQVRDGDVIAKTLDGQTYTMKAPKPRPVDKPQARLNPGTIALCNAGLGDVVVKKFKTKYNGEVKLRCGNDKVGYVHIRKGHEKEWRSMMPGPGVWDDFMVWSVTQALQSPSAAPLQSGNKRCYSTPIKLYKIVNRKLQYWRTFYPAVPISTNNKVVITAFPPTYQWCK